MATQEKNTKTSITDFSIRDVIRTMKKNVKAVNVLKNVGANKPGIKEAIIAITAENEKLKTFAMQMVGKQIDAAMAEDE